MKCRVVLLGLVLAACARGHVTTTESAVTGPLPPPAHVVVTDFAVVPAVVQLDSGVGPRAERAAAGMSPLAAQETAAQETQAALAETLAVKLTAYGLPVQRAPVGMVPPAGSLLVQGQILSIDEGNRTRRNLVGLGAGKSSVRAESQLYYVADAAHPQFLREFAGSADSGRMPGAVGTMGAGTAAGHLATSAAVSGVSHAGAEMHRTTDTANADQVAQALARQIAAYAVSQGWLPASALH
jgi:Domain of unknown function (DUF4410)